MNTKDTIDQPKIAANYEVSILHRILQEIAATSQEYWSNLLDMCLFPWQPAQAQTQCPKGNPMYHSCGQVLNF